MNPFTNSSLTYVNNSKALHGYSNFCDYLNAVVCGLVRQLAVCKCSLSLLDHFVSGDTHWRFLELSKKVEGCLRVVAKIRVLFVIQTLLSINQN